MGQNRSFLSNLQRLAVIYYHYRIRSTSLPYKPIYAGIETSGLCNLRCVMCPHGQPQYMYHKRGYMTMEIFQRVVDEAKSFINEADLFGGGEPLLNPHIFDMIAYAKAAGIHTRIHTNATLLTREKAQALLDSGLDFLSLSFEGYTKEIYEQTRVNAIYEVTIENIRNFLNMKSGGGYKKPYTVLQVLRPAPEDQTEEMKAGLINMRREFASYAGLDEFRVVQVHNYGGKVLCARRGTKARYAPCTFLWYAVFVLWDGTIVPCCVDWWGEYTLGNIRDTSLEQVWNGEKMRYLRATLANGRYQLIPLCRECDRLWRPVHFGVPFRDIKLVKHWLSEHLFGF